MRRRPIIQLRRGCGTGGFRGFSVFPLFAAGAGDADGAAVFQLRLEGETRDLTVFEDGGHADALIGGGFYGTDAGLATVQSGSHHPLGNAGLDAHGGEHAGKGHTGGQFPGFFHDFRGKAVFHLPHKSWEVTLREGSGAAYSFSLVIFMIFVLAVKGC